MGFTQAKKQCRTQKLEMHIEYFTVSATNYLSRYCFWEDKIRNRCLIPWVEDTTRRWAYFHDCICIIERRRE